MIMAQIGGNRDRPLRGLALLFGLLALPASIQAHRLDEYLQATLVTIEPNGIRLQINLTPGVAVAEKVLAQIDRDGNGLISTNETAAYAELLRHDLSAQLDHRPAELKLAASNFPTPEELRTGLGIIQVEFSLASGPLAAGLHRFNLENRHMPSMSVYLFNAAQPDSDLIQSINQKRNDNQSIGEIEFNRRPSPNASTAITILCSFALLLVVSAGIWWVARRRTRVA